MSRSGSGPRSRLHVARVAARFPATSSGVKHVRRARRRLRWEMRVKIVGTSFPFVFLRFLGKSSFPDTATTQDSGALSRTQLLPDAGRPLCAQAAS